MEKKVRMSFEISMNVLLAALSQHHDTLEIEVFDKTSRKPRLNGHGPKLLEGPKPRAGHGHGKVSAYAALLAHFAQHRDKAILARDLKPLMRSIGLAENSVSPQLTMLCKHGFVKRTSNGTYQATARGVAEQDKRAAAQAEV